MQKVSISGISRNGRSIDQERFQSTLPDLLFMKFDRSGHAKSFSCWNITEQEIYRSRMLSINPTNVIAS